MIVDFFNALNRAFDKVIRVFLVILLTILLVVLFYQILSRHLTFLPPALWSEEFARFLFIWLILAGATKAFIIRNHFTIDFFEAFQGAKLLLLLDVIINVIRLSVSIFFVIYGAEYVEFGLMQTSDYMGVNMGWAVYSSIFISAVLWTMASIYFVCQSLRDLYKGLR